MGPPQTSVFDSDVDAFRNFTLAATVASFDVQTCGTAAQKQADYRGAISVTATGKTCQFWSSQTPHAQATETAFPDKGVGDHNHCRNPDNGDETWCYTTDLETEWEYCQVPT